MKTKKAETTAQTLAFDVPTTWLMFTYDKTPPAHAGSFCLNLWEISSVSMGTCHLPPPALSGGQNFP